MGEIKGYLLSIIAAAVICGIVTRLIGEKGTQGAMVKLIAGLFLTFTVINPVVKMDINGLTDFADVYSDAGSQAAAAGEQMSADALRASIKARTEAYILDKAAGLELNLEVEVTLSEDDIPLPASVRLSGKTSPYAKLRLQSMITQELGIEKENQVWI